MNTVERATVGLGIGLMTVGVVVLGLVETLAGQPFHPTNAKGEVLAGATVDPTLRTGLVVAGLLVLLAYGLYGLVTPVDVDEATGASTAD